MLPVSDRAIVAVVDDDPELRLLVRVWLEAEGFAVVECAGGREAMAPASDRIEAVCLDLGLGDVPGIDVLQHLRARDPDLPVVIITARADVDAAVEAMRFGAYDYVRKPFERERLCRAVHRAVEHRRLLARLSDELQGSRALGSLVGTSPAMRELGEQIARVLESDVSVAILGESGTGKELVAQAIHAGGRRRAGPFVAINCASIAESLLESELFGHERGAFTGAVGTRKGCFEHAHGGTLFLDEIGETSAAIQASLLRTLQERTVRRIGSHVEIPVNVRLVCATHRDLRGDVAAGRFREDLYYRLVVYPVTVPPLRARREDVPTLVAHFLRAFRQDVGRAVERVSPEALEALVRYDWPGNVRELQNVVHAAMLASPSDQIALGHLPPHIRDVVLPRLPGAGALPSRIIPPDAIVPLAELERREIDRALEATGGNIGEAAALLGIGRTTLYRKLAKPAHSGRSE